MSVGKLFLFINIGVLSKLELLNAVCIGMLGTSRNVADYKPFTSEGAIFGLLIRYVLLCQLRCTKLRSSICLLSRYVLLYQLGTHNRTLLFYVLMNNLEELAPIVYTPIVGALFGHRVPCAAPSCSAIASLSCAGTREREGWKRAQSRIEDGAEALPVKIL